MRRAPEIPRKSARARGYDRPWEKTRKAKLERDPLCEDCLEQEFRIPAKDVHHLIKIEDAPQLKHEYSNLRSLCKRCHSIRTRRGE